jgi:metastasis-associated protein MTA
MNSNDFYKFLFLQDAFFYTLVYDPVQRTLLADRGEIRVGSRYQAEATPLLKEGKLLNRDF